MLSQKSQANDLLKFSIGLLQGKHGWVLKCNRYQRIRCAESIAERLAENGFWWQAQIIWTWIHRCKRGDFDVDVHVNLKFTRRRSAVTSLSERERGDSY